MFEANDEKYLVRSFNQNRVVLFAGAGFSCGAESRIGNRLPVGTKLSELIWKYLRYTGEYDGSPLVEMFSALLKRGLPYQEISRFIESIFIVDDVPEYYKKISVPHWRRIYTTNIDNVLDVAFAKSDKKLEIIKYPNDDVAERDAFLNKIQVYHLNGKLPCRPDEVTFSFEQFAEASNKKQPLYEEFVRDYSTHPTIFVGTELNEPIFWQCVTSRRERFAGGTEFRPKSFLISPRIAEPKKEVLAEYNILPIEATAEDFFNWIESNKEKFLSKKDVLLNIQPSLVDVLQELAPDLRDKKSVEAFASAFTKVPTDRPSRTGRSLYLLGAAPSWEDMHAGLDAPRTITTRLLDEVEAFIDDSNELKIIAVLGSAGCGKSTIIRRLAINLAQRGRAAYLTNSESLPDVNSVKVALGLIREKAVLIFDNSEVSLGYIPSLANELNGFERSPVIVIASRTNDFDRISGRFRGGVNIIERHIPNLDDNEIRAVIDTLERNHLPGILRGMTPQQKFDVFKRLSNKQILVAMREATSGRGFDEIIKDEFDTLTPVEAKKLYLCCALATEAGYRITKDELVSCSNVNPSEALNLLYRNLRDIVVESGANEELLLLRHRLIAEYAVETVAPRQWLSDAYIALINMLSTKYNNNSKNSRDMKLLRDLLNHKVIYRRFTNDIMQARNIYSSIANQSSRDPHFWLQYGSLELEGSGGDLQLAENYLNQARSLDQTNNYIINAQGHLQIKKAIDANNLQAALLLRDEGTATLMANIQASRHGDAYSIHILCSQRYNFMKRWYHSDDAVKRDELQFLLGISRAGRAANPRINRLRELNERLEQAYLELSLPDYQRSDIQIE